MTPHIFPPKNLKCGDLIEIFRGEYQHWAMYVGDGDVIHLATTSEHADAGAGSVKSVLQNKATVKREKLKDVVGNDRYKINNRLDDQCGPRPIQTILQDADRLVGVELPYDLLAMNCEHFVTLLRYGKPQSQQVEKATNIASAILFGAAVFFGIIAVAKAVTKEKNKPENEK
ncbi:phospholipase A and acyltransferase 4-like [Pseudorasbora parva]|uniref:phospholipase A and acyltransferase 4-like n=1 Tax=Pseudorasbora parva TaxID=51549 RepID=UPI00351E1BC0